ncbi:unnamed protein product [Symbiodinium sp. CCMP2456]|nr:unnamed protein product [Symbiodinium sp. CCMP2456]
MSASNAQGASILNDLQAAVEVFLAGAWQVLSPGRILPVASAGTLKVRLREHPEVHGEWFAMGQLRASESFGSFSEAARQLDKAAEQEVMREKYRNERKTAAQSPESGTGQKKNKTWFWRFANCCCNEVARSDNIPLPLALLLTIPWLSLGLFAACVGSLCPGLAKTLGIELFPESKGHNVEAPASEASLVFQGSANRGTLSAAVVFLRDDIPEHVAIPLEEEIPGDCWCYALFGQQKQCGCRWFSIWTQNVDEAVKQGAQLHVYYCRNSVGKGKAQSFQTLAAEHERREKLNQLFEQFQHSGEFQALRMAGLDNLSREAGEDGTSRYSREVRRLFRDSGRLSEEDAQFLRSSAGLEDIQKAQVAWLERKGYRYSELDVGIWLAPLPLKMPGSMPSVPPGMQSQAMPPVPVIMGKVVESDPEVPPQTRPEGAKGYGGELWKGGGKGGKGKDVGKGRGGKGGTMTQALTPLQPQMVMAPAIPGPAKGSS